MTTKEQRSREIKEAIRAVFVNDWDPIGVMKDPDWPRDEYDNYICEIYVLLDNGKSPEFIADYLRHIEEESIGVSSHNTVSRLLVAKKLKAIDVS